MVKELYHFLLKRTLNNKSSKKIYFFLIFTFSFAVVCVFLILFQFRGIGTFVLDLDGDGVEFIDLKNSNAYFDLNGNNFATKSSWVSSDDGFLVHDLNGDGKINNVHELFGNPEQKGFKELARTKTMMRLLIRSILGDLNNLQVWRDLNGDGISQEGELKSLSDYNITDINFANTGQGPVHSKDTQILSRGIYTMNTDPGNSETETYATIVAADFSTLPELSRYVGDVTIDEATSLTGNIKGYGLIPDLHYAMSLDESLKNLVIAGVKNLTLKNALDTFDSILFKWADVENITIDKLDPDPSLAPDPDTGVVTFNNAGTSLTLEQLGFLKNYAGRDDIQIGDGQWVDKNGAIQTTGQLYKNAWDKARNNLFSKFVVSNGLLDNIIPGGVTYDINTDELSVKFNIKASMPVISAVACSVLENSNHESTVNAIFLETLVLSQIYSPYKDHFKTDLINAITSPDAKGGIITTLENEYFLRLGIRESLKVLFETGK